MSFTPPYRYCMHLLYSAVEAASKSVVIACHFAHPECDTKALCGTAHTLFSSGLAITEHFMFQHGHGWMIRSLTTPEGSQAGSIKARNIICKRGLSSPSASLDLAGGQQSHGSLIPETLSGNATCHICWRCQQNAVSEAPTGSCTGHSMTPPDLNPGFGRLLTEF